MPRPQRVDIQPLIIVPDIRLHKEAASNVVPNEFTVSVSRRGPHPHGGFHITTAAYYGYLELLRQDGISLPFDLLTLLMGRIEYARSVPIPPNDLSTQPPAGMMVVRVDEVGCRVWMTQAEMGEALGVCRATIIEKLKILKNHDLIENWGHGWVELSAYFVWKGDESLRREYAKQQPRHHSKWVLPTLV